MSEYGGNNLQKQRQSFISSGTDKFLHYPCTGEVKNKAKASLNLPLTILARFSCLGKICSCTSFHLSRFMNKFSSWNRYKRPFQIRGVFSGSWSFVFFLQIGQFHVSARTRSSYPTQVDYKNWWVFLEGVFFFIGSSLGWTFWALSIQLWFWPGIHLWPLFGQLQLHSSLILDVINIDSCRVWLYRRTILLLQRFSNFSPYFHHIEPQFLLTEQQYSYINTSRVGCDILGGLTQFSLITNYYFMQTTCSISSCFYRFSFSDTEAHCF